MPASNKNILRFLTIGLLAVLATGAYAQSDVDAADVEARLTSLEARVQSVMRANINLMRTNSQLQRQIEQLQASSVDGLNEFVSVDIDQHGRPAVFFDAVNLYVRDGSGSSYTLGDSGLGNIILGYNETANSSVDHFCTSSYSLSTHKHLHTWEDCYEAGFEWTNNNKSGTHNLIIGSGHNYAGEGNIIIGAQNSVSDMSNIVSGNHNYAGGSAAILASDRSKGFFQTSILSSSKGFVYNGSIISSFGSSITEGYGTVIGSSDVAVDTFGEEIYIHSEPYTSE